MSLLSLVFETQLPDSPKAAGRAHSHSKSSSDAACGLHCQELHRSLLYRFTHFLLQCLINVVEVATMPFFLAVDTIKVTSASDALSLREAAVRGYCYFVTLVIPLWITQTMQPNFVKHTAYTILGRIQSLCWWLWPTYIRTDDFVAYEYNNLSQIHGRVRKRDTAYVLFCHGGGYLSGSAMQYPASFTRWLKQFSQQNRALRIYSLDYTLIDITSTYTGLPNAEAINEGIALYDHMVYTLKIDSKQICIAGDSAGGNLAAVLSLVIRDTNRPAAGSMILFSPWVHVGSEMLPRDADCRDVFHSHFLYLYSKWFIDGGIDHKHPYLSPVHADLHALPPTYVHYAKKELIARSIAKFVDKLREAGSLAHVHQCEYSFHVSPLLHDWMGRRCRQQLDEIINWHMEQVTHHSATPRLASDSPTATKAVHHNKSLIAKAQMNKDRHSHSYHKNANVIA